MHCTVVSAAKIMCKTVWKCEEQQNNNVNHGELLFADEERENLTKARRKTNNSRE